MKFAINYSPQAAELYSIGRIALDYFKCPDWPNLITEASQYRPVAVHFSLEAGTGRLAQTDWKMIERWLVATGTPYVNLHLAAYKSDFPGVEMDLTSSSTKQFVIRQIEADVQAVIDHFGPEKVIAENLFPYAGPGEEFIPIASEPEVIRQVIEGAGCGMLLDISHARISARHLGIEEEDYLERLPVQQLREMHFAGIHTLDGRLTDHLSIQPEDWLALERILTRIRYGSWPCPWMLAFEYGGVGETLAWRSESKVIADQVPRLYDLVTRV